MAVVESAVGLAVIGGVAGKLAEMSAKTLAKETKSIINSCRRTANAVNGKDIAVGQQQNSAPRASGPSPS